MGAEHVSAHPPETPPPDLLGIVAALQKHAVEFVVIGGFAVILHGAERYTKDNDVVPEQSVENLARLWSALEELEAKPRELAEFRPDDMPMPFSLQGLVDGGGNWVLETRLGRLNVMQWVSGVDTFEQLRANAVTVSLPETDGETLFAGLDDLLAMKRAAGRDQDLMDITALRMAHGLEE